MCTYELTTDDLYVDTQADFAIVLNGRTYKGRSGFSVKKDVGFDQLGFEQFNFYLSVECRKEDVDLAIFQCIMYLKRMYEIETDKEVIFNLFSRVFWLNLFLNF